MSISGAKRRQVEELLPFFVNGTLSGDEKQEVSAALQADAGLRAQAEMLARLAAEIRAADSEPSPGEFGLARLNRSLDREANGRVVRRASLGLVAAALAAGVFFAVQTQREGAANGGYVQASAGADAGILDVTFAPNATEEQIRTLLLDNGLVIVDGPSAMGLYRLRLVEDGDIAAAAEALRAKPAIVETADGNQ